MAHPQLRNTHIPVLEQPPMDCAPEEECQHLSPQNQQFAAMCATQMVSSEQSRVAHLNLAMLVTSLELIVSCLMTTWLTIYYSLYDFTKGSLNYNLSSVRFS